MRRGALDPDWVAPHPVQRRSSEPTGAPGASGVLLGLQRSAGNAAVAGRLAAPSGVLDGSPMAFVQRCGPTPCSCSAEEKADYAEQHPDEASAPDADAQAAGAGHQHT